VIPRYPPPLSVIAASTLWPDLVSFLSAVRCFVVVLPSSSSVGGESSFVLWRCCRRRIVRGRTWRVSECPLVVECAWRVIVPNTPEEWASPTYPQRDQCRRNSQWILDCRWNFHEIFDSKKCLYLKSELQRSDVMNIDAWRVGRLMGFVWGGCPVGFIWGVAAWWVFCLKSECRRENAYLVRPCMSTQSYSLIAYVWKDFESLDNVAETGEFGQNK